MTHSTLKPLDGILVVALEQAVAAPLCSCRLADAGARVIKIERPEGDFARGYDSVVHGEASYFVWLNRGKESIVLNLKDTDDLAFLHRMLAKADVFVQNLAYGATERLGIGSEQLREWYPQLITCDIGGYGEGQDATDQNSDEQNGAAQSSDEPSYRDMKAYDLLIQCESGLVSISGAPGEYGRIGVSISDIGTGMNAAQGVMQALFLRERTGKATGVKTSLFESTVDWMTVPLTHHDYGGKAPTRVGLNHPSISPYGGYETQNGEIVVISIQNNREWARFCIEILARPEMVDDPAFATNNARVANRTQIDQAIRAIFSTYTRSDLMQKLSANTIACGALNSVADLSVHPQLRRWPMQVNGEMAEITAPAINSEHDEGMHRPIPHIGEHSEKIRAEFA